MPVLAGSPVVTLRHASARPYDAAIAAARTCYAPRVIGAEEVTPSQRETIGPLTFEGGHHTVWQHAHFEFGLENVSRQFVWSFLHSHPFYNSEQSSQRFVRLDEARALVPEGLSGEALAVYEGAVEAAWESYRRLTQLLKQDTLRILSGLRHLTPNASDKRRKKVEREAEKKAIETARYVIPVAAFTSMVHTVSGIVLHRLHRMMRTGDAPAETRAVVEAMVGLVKEKDPAFFERIGQGPLAEGEVVEARLPRLEADGDAEAARLDARLGERVSLLVDYMARAEETTAEAVRAVARGLPGRAGRRRGARAAPRPRDQPLSPGDAAALRALPARAGDAPRLLHLPEEALPHRGQPGPAAPHGAGLAPAPDAHRHAPARLRHAPARRREPGGARGVPGGDGPGVGGQEPPAGDGRARSSGAVPAARTPRPCASTRAAASSTSPTSGSCAPASTRRRRSTAPRWTSWSR